MSVLHSTQIKHNLNYTIVREKFKFDQTRPTYTMQIKLRIPSKSDSNIRGTLFVQAFLLKKSDRFTSKP